MSDDGCITCEGCVTCGDSAVVATVVALRGADATIEVDGVREDVAIELVGGIAVGDRLLCHAGVALQRAELGDHDAERDAQACTLGG